LPHPLAVIPGIFVRSINLVPTKAAPAKRTERWCFGSSISDSFRGDVSNLLAPFSLRPLTICYIWILFTLFDRLFGIRHELVIDTARGLTLSASLSSLLSARRSTMSMPLPSSWLSWTLVFAVGVSAALIGIEAWQMWQVRESTLRDAKFVTTSLAHSVSQQIETTLKTADTVVASLLERVEAESANPEFVQSLYPLMTSLASALPAIHEMGITDKDGNALVKSLVPHPVGMNYRERDYFQFHQTHNNNDLYVGVLVRSKVDGSVNITASRRINKADGSFAGVVVASISLDFFQKLFESILVNSGGHISLVADNGMLLVRSPAAPRGGGPQIGETDVERDALSDAAPDALDYLSPSDHVRRVGSYSRVPHYPLLALVTQDDREILRAWRAQARTHAIVVVGVLIAIAVLGLRVHRANRATKMQAFVDNLTGLANRRYLNQAMKLEFRRAARAGHPISFVMIDLDLFKSFNDRYGHPAGDDCLRAVSKAIQGVLRRPGDVAARYGGEEIALLLPGTDLVGAVRMAEDARQAVTSLGLRHEGSPYGIVTLSAGVGSYQHVREPATWPSLIKAADEALYAAKAEGRNTIAVQGSAQTLARTSLMSAATA
jgi:diguanylate cyclase (GGDEF)-like protein